MSALLSLLLTSAPAANLYDLDLALVDQYGKSVRLDSFRGHPVVISMFYGTCTSACPLLVAKVKALEAKLSIRARKDLRVLLVSFDPDRDTTVALQKLATSFSVDDRWVLAHSSADSVRELAAALGIRYRFLSSGMIDHASVLTVLDRAGTITARIDGLEDPAEALVQKLEVLGTP